MAPRQPGRTARLLAQMFAAAGMPRHDDFAVALAALARQANATDGHPSSGTSR
ncbi:hypothetical protein [Micromonospora fulviviridis]|uniref:hypothetical protein n=1 Tax=Micromonospora fulviviridis TaxID=47860 RepID=UPI0037875FDC